MAAKDLEIRIRSGIGRIEAEMKKAGVWSATPPPPQAFRDRAAFGGATLTFVQWLQFVFVPRVHETLKAGGPWPRGSSVGTQAVREFDGTDELSALTGLLCDFDALFD